MPDNPEARVVRSLKEHLSEHGAFGLTLESIVTDAHPTYTSASFARELEPFVRVSIDQRRPDLLARGMSQHGPVLVGFEVKAHAGNADEGLAQADVYRSGCHVACLALRGSAQHARRIRQRAQRTGIGVLLLDNDCWVEIVEPEPPRPIPALCQDIDATIRCAPVMRRLGLNHPKNFLAATVTAAHTSRGTDLHDAFSREWDALGNRETRSMAIEAARAFGLLNSQDRPTRAGTTVAEILQAVGLDHLRRLPKGDRRRLLTASEPIAAVARLVLLQHPATQLILEVLDECSHSMATPELAERSIQRSPSLGLNLFYAKASSPPFNSTTVYQFKQNLWHAGLLATKAHTTAGKGASMYLPDKDRWAAEVRTRI